jgi:hypothetical protein
MAENPHYKDKELLQLLNESQVEYLIVGGSLEDLVTNKQALGRSSDLKDLEQNRKGARSRESAPSLDGTP